MKRQMPSLLLILLSGTWSLTNAHAMFGEGNELAERFARLHAAQREDPDRGQRLAEEAEASRKRQKKAVKEHNARIYMEKQIRDWKWGVNYERFSSEEQNGLEALLPQIIKNFEEEQKLSHGTAESLFVELSRLDFQSLMGKLQTLGNSNVLNQQRQRRLQLEQEDESLNDVAYAYNRLNFVFLSEDKDSYYKIKNFIPKKSNLTENDLQYIYTHLKIDINGSVDKKDAFSTAIARRHLFELIEKETGILFLPTTTDRKLNVLIKVLRGAQQETDYIFYNKQNLPLGLKSDQRYAHLEEDHTFVALNHLIFAIPNEGPEKEILSLSTQQVLRGIDMKAIYAMAETVWTKRRLEARNNLINEPEIFEEEDNSEGEVIHSSEAFEYDPQEAICQFLISDSESEDSEDESEDFIGSPEDGERELEDSEDELIRSIRNTDTSESEEDFWVEEEVAPIFEDAPIEELKNLENEEHLIHILEEVLIEEEVAPVLEDVPAMEQVAPVLEEVPAMEQVAPVLEEVPAMEQVAPVLEEVPAMEQVAPVFEEVPAMEQVAPVLEEVPAMEQVAPVLEEVPAMEQVAPVFEEVPATLNAIPLVREEDSEDEEEEISIVRLENSENEPKIPLLQNEEPIIKSINIQSPPKAKSIITKNKRPSLSKLKAHIKKYYKKLKVKNTTVKKKSKVKKLRFSQKLQKNNDKSSIRLKPMENFIKFIRLCSLRIQRYRGGH